MKPSTCSRCGAPFEHGVKSCTCPTFFTITGDDWRRSLRHARVRQQLSAERIRNQLNPQKP